MQIAENTVSAENQMVNSTELSFLGTENAPLRVLVLGNSITCHGPKADIGWQGDWGMAASAPEKDYVHRLYTKFKEAGQDVYMRIRQSAYWERHFGEDDCLPRFAADRYFGADLIVFRLGDNIPEENAPGFPDALRQFMTYLGAKPGKVIFSTCWTAGWLRITIADQEKRTAPLDDCPKVLMFYARTAAMPQKIRRETTVSTEQTPEATEESCSVLPRLGVR